MAFGFSRTKVSPIAIDFGSHWLKLLQIVPGNPPQLVAAAGAEVPEAARHDAGERQRFLSDALRDALRRQPFKGRRAICSLPAYQTLVQNLELSRATGPELAELVADQLRQRLNVDPARMVIRHYDVGQISRNGSTLQHVLCLAASRDIVMHYIDLCAQCKLDVVGMHSEPTAILQAFEGVQADGAVASENAKAVCYIDLGATTTKLAITHGNALVFAKTIHAEAERLVSEPATAAAQHQQGGAANAAESAQTDAGAADTQTGLAVLDAAGGEGGGAAGAPSAKPWADDTLECLIDELQMCLRYHQSLFPQKAVEKLVFLGGAARHVRTCQRIAQAVRIAAQLGDPLARLAHVSAAKPPLGVDFDQSQPGWAVPFGLSHCEANL